MRGRKHLRAKMLEEVRRKKKGSPDPMRPVGRGKRAGPSDKRKRTRRAVSTRHVYSRRKEHREGAQQSKPTER